MRLSSFAVQDWPITLLFYGIAAVSLGMVALTFVLLQPGLVEVHRTLATHFTYRAENTFAAWWSGTIFALVAVLAFDGFVKNRRSQPRTAKSYAALSLVLFILSADEVSSLHERANTYLQLGTWASLLPFGLVLLALLVYGVAALPKDQVWPILLAFVLLGSVVLQEVLEHKIDFGEWNDVRRTIEEGSEVVGALILLALFLHNSQSHSGQRWASVPRALGLTRMLRFPPLVIGLGVAPVVAYLTSELPDQGRGHPADWLAAMFFLFAALSSSGGLPGVRRGVRPSGWGMFAICLLASVMFVAVNPGTGIDVAWAHVDRRVIALFGLSIAFGAVWAIEAKKLSLSTVGLVIATFLLGVFSLFQSSLLARYALPQYLALLAFYATGTRIRTFCSVGTTKTL